MTQAEKQHPLKWRLADIDGTGMDQVSIVMPEYQGKQQEMLLPTEIPSPLTSAMDIGWSEEDSYLFYILLNKMIGDEVIGEAIDFEDPEVLDILHVVAAAHFIAPVDADHVLADDLPVILEEHDLGDLVAINTRAGFKTALICELDSVEASCVLLEPLELNEEEVLDVYDTLVVNKHSILPPEFGNVVPAEEAVIH